MPVLTRFRSFATLFLLGLCWAQAAAAQPTFTKAFQPDTIGPGSTSALVFTINNASGTQVSGLAFTDNLPAAVTLAAPVSPQNGCGGTLTAPAGGGTITFSGGSVGPSTSCQIRVDVTSAAVGTHTNTSGDLTSSAGNSGPASDDLTVSANRPGFSKSFSPSPVQFGGRSTLTFTIDNSANGSAMFNLSFSDNLPSGLVVAGPANVATDCPLASSGSVTAAPGTDVISYNSGPIALAAGATCALSVDVHAGAGGQLNNRSGELLSTSGGPLVSSGFAVAPLQVNVDNLALTKQFTDDPARPGDTVTMRFSITNFDRGNSATNIGFSDDLDATLSGLAPVAPLPADPCGAGSALSTSPLTLAGGNLGPGESCTFDVTLQVPAGATPGVYPNTTSSVTGDVGGSPVVGAAASDDLFVQASPSLTKTFLDPGTLTPVSSVQGGDEVVMEFSVTNTSTTSGASDVEFTDNLAQFLSGSVVTALPGAGACGAGSSVTAFSVGAELTLMLIDGDLPSPGASCTFQVTLRVPEGTANGTYTNLTSGVTATVDGETITGPPASADLNVLAPPTLGKAFTSGAPPGGTVDLEFSLALSENAPTAATDVSFADDLDATLTGLTAVSLPADGFCGPASQVTGTSVLTVTGASLDPGTSCSFTVTLQVPAGAAPGDYTNTTSDISAIMDGRAVTAPGVSAPLRVVGLVLDKDFTDDPAVAGGTANLQFTLDNSASPSAASDISFSDDLGNVIAGMTASNLPADGFCGAGSQMAQSGDTLIVSGASLAAGATCTFAVTVQIPAGTPSATYTNATSNEFATIDGIPASPPPASAELTVIDPLAIGKEFTDDPAAPGDTVTLEFTLTNNSPVDAATALTFTDDLDAALSGLTAVGLPQNDVCGAGSQISGTSLLTLTGGNLAAGTSCTFSVTVQVPAGAAAGSTVVNTTSQLSGQVGGVAATAPAASDTLRIDLVRLTKSFGGPAGAGTSVVLSFQIQNQSTSPVSGLAFTDDLNAALTGLAATGLPAAPCGAGSSITGTSLLTFTGGSLAAGASCSFDVTLQVPAGAAPGSYPNTTSELTSQGQPLGTAATASLVIEPAPLFSKVFAPNAIAVGGVSTLSFTVDNSAGSVAAADLAFTDNLPAGLAVAPAPNASTTCTGGTLTATPGSGTISYSGGSVAAGATCTLQVDVSGTAEGSFVNTSTALTSSLGTSGTASDTLDVLSGEFQVTKSFQTSPVLPAGVVTMELSIVNGSTFPLTDIALTDDLGAVLPGLAAEGLPMADVCGAGSQVSGTSVVSLTGGNLAPGASCTVAVPVRVPGDAPDGGYLNTTSAATGMREGVPVDADPATAELVVERLSFSKTFAPDTLGAGDTTTLSFAVSNPDPANAVTGLSFNDNLDAALSGLAAVDTPLSDACGAGSQVTGTGTVSLTGGNITAGGSCSFDVTVQVPAGAASGDYTNTTGALTGQVSGVATSAPGTSDVLTVAGVPAFDKAFAETPVPVGFPVTLTFTIDNSANSIAADNLSFTDNLPAGMVVADPANAGTTCTGGTISASPGATAISYSGGSVAAGAICTVQVDVVINNPGSYTNVTEILSSSLGDSGTASAFVQAQRAGPIPALGAGGLALLTLAMVMLGLATVRARPR